MSRGCSCSFIFFLYYTFFQMFFATSRGFTTTTFRHHAYHRHAYSSKPRLLSSANNGNHNNRQSILHEKLESLGVNATLLQESHEQFVQDPTLGYNPAFGKSALKAYRSFLQSEASSTDTLQSTAGSCARQVDFLIKRHVAAQADWIRHLDATETTGASKKKTKFPLILILDNVRSAMNVGSLFRTADATACQALYTTGITPHPNGNGMEKLRKSALGADATVPHQHFTTLQDAIHHLRQQQLKSLDDDNKQSTTDDDGDGDDDGDDSTTTTTQEQQHYTIIGMETTSYSQLYTELNYTEMIGNDHGAIAIVLGNEVTGLSPDVLSSCCDAVVEIPMFGTKNSLNIAACAPILLYEILRQIKA